MRGEKADNRILVAALINIKPSDLAENAWCLRAGIHHNFIRDLRNGKRPWIYNIEKLTVAAGVPLSELWAIVEKMRADERE